MNKRIAKKVKGDPKRYHTPQISKAARRLGESIMVMGIDMAAEGTKDYSAHVTYYTETGRFSSRVLNKSNQPKQSFHHRTGQAPTTPGAIPATSVGSDGDVALIMGK